MKNFCVQPFIGLAILPTGSIVPCGDSIAKYQLGNIYFGDTVTSVWRGKELDDLREKIKSGSNISLCQRCYDVERSGLDSKRVIKNRKWQKKLRIKGQDTYRECLYANNRIKFLDISFGNKCNQKCVMCSPVYSSQWVKHKDLFDLVGIRYNSNETNERSIPYGIVDDILENCRNLIKLNIKGGEPLVDRKCIYFLDRLSHINPNIDNVSIVTNGTILSREILNILNKFKNISVAFSIDGTSKINEWIRGSSSIIILNNLRKLAMLDSLVEIRIHHTISAYNFWDTIPFIELTQKIKKDIFGKKGKAMSVNLKQYVEQPYISVKNIPIDFRKKAIAEIEKKLQITDKSFYGKEELLRYVCLPESAGKDQSDFLKWTNTFNKIRNLDIYKIVPELNEVKKYIELNKYR